MLQPSFVPLLFCVLLYDLNGSASLGAAGNADAGWL